jgi:hypothetical protein
VETGAWTEIDTAKASPVGGDLRTRMLDAVSRAMIGRAFNVTLDAHGTPVAVAGFREALAAGLKGSPEGEKLPLSEIYDDKKCMGVARSLFLTTPTGAHAVGAMWTEDVTADAGGHTLGFSAESTLSAATEDDATVTSKLSFKPKPKEMVGRTKVTGGGDSKTKFSRKDGFVLSMKRHLEANPETAARKGTSHTDVTIERLPAKAAAAEPADPQTKIETTNTRMRAVKDAVLMYYLKHSRIPASLVELCGPEGDDQRLLESEKPPKDGWGNEFVYTPKDKRKFDLVSYGADGRPGGEKDDADITVSR